MSYASVASKNIPPLSLQPQPDPALLNTGTHPPGPVISRETIAENPASLPQPHTGSQTSSGGDFSNNVYAFPNGKKRTGGRDPHLLDTAKEYLFRPTVAGGLLGLVNIGVLAGTGRMFYIKPDYRRDPTVVSSTVVAAFLLLLAEGYAAEKVRETPEGRDAEARIRTEGSLLYKHLHEIVLRPGVMGGFVGIVNMAALGAVGYLSYQKWNTPLWDRKKAIILSAGLLSLLAGEAFGAVQYMKTQEGHEAQHGTGSEVHKRPREIGVLGGLLGLVNTGILGAVAYYGYVHWDK